MTTHVLLERTFDPAISAAFVYERARRTGWCYEMHRVDWRASFLANDGRHMVCWFTAPDAESARNALRKAEVDAQVLWPGTYHEAPEPVVPNVLVQRVFAEPVELEAVQSIEDAAAWCLQAHRVKFAWTFFSADRKRMLCLYQAPDAESVRIAQREAGMPFQAVWAFERIGPDTMISAA